MNEAEQAPRIERVAIPVREALKMAVSQDTESTETEEMPVESAPLAMPPVSKAAGNPSSVRGVFAEEQSMPHDDDDAPPAKSPFKLARKYAPALAPPPAALPKAEGMLTKNGFAGQPGDAVPKCEFCVTRLATWGRTMRFCSSTCAHSFSARGGKALPKTTGSKTPAKAETPSKAPQAVGRKCEMCGGPTNNYSSSGRFCSSSCSHRFSGRYAAIKAQQRKDDLIRKAKTVVKSQKKVEPAAPQPATTTGKASAAAATRGSEADSGSRPLRHSTIVARSKAPPEPKGGSSKSPEKKKSQAGAPARGPAPAGALPAGPPGLVDPRQSVRTDFMALITSNARDRVESPFVTAKVKLSSSQAADACGTCGSGGQLICCTGCPQGFHLGCLDPPLKSVPEGDWWCRLCLSLAADPSADKPEGPLEPLSGFLRDVRQKNVVSLVLDGPLHDEYTREMGGDWIRCESCKGNRPVDADMLSEVLEYGLRCKDMFWLDNCRKQGCKAAPHAAAHRQEGARAKRRKLREECFEKDFGNEDASIFGLGLSKSEESISKRNKSNETDLSPGGRPQSRPRPEGAEGHPLLQLTSAISSPAEPRQSDVPVRDEPEPHGEPKMDANSSVQNGENVLKRSPSTENVGSVKELLKTIAELDIDDQDFEDRLVLLALEGDKDLLSLHFGFRNRLGRFLRHARNLVERRDALLSPAS